MPPAGYAPTGKSQGGDTTLDSDFNIATNLTDVIVLGANEAKTDIDAGLVFVSVNISGNIFNDGDGDANVNGTAINAPSATPLHATLLDAGGAVLATTAITATGTYSFSSADGIVANTAYKVVVSTVASATTSTLPTDWQNTGENLNAAGAGNDGVVDGVIDVAVATSDVTQIDFGINHRPTADSKSEPSQVNPGGTTQVTVPTLTGADDETNATITYTITTLPANATLYYNGTAINAVNFVVADPTLLTVDPTDNGATTVVFNYTTTDDNGYVSAPATVTMPFGSDSSILGNVSHETDTGTLEGIANVQVILVDENGATVATTVTDSEGNYLFENIATGNYLIREVQPEGYTDVRENEGGADNDSYTITAINEIAVVVAGGEDDTQNDFVEVSKSIVTRAPTPTPTPTPRPNPVAFSNASQIGDILNDSPIADAIDSREGDYFSFVAPQSGLYIFTSDVNTFTGAAIYDRNEVRLNLNEFSDVGNFTIRQTLKNGERYYIRIYANQDTNYVLTVDYVSINDFVERFYTDMLGRSADVAGLQYWVDLLSDGVLSGVDVAHGFGNSPEFTGRNLNDNDYLTTLYQTFFDRTPDAQGLVFWLDKLQNGMSRSEVLDGFANSKEFKEKTASYGIKHTSTLTEKFVNRLYAIGLTRYPDGAGFRYWVNGLTQGQFNARIAVTGFVFSDEFINRNLDNTSYVQTLYRMLFDRAADTTGLNTWVTKLNNGETREAVLDGFLNSQEFIEIMKMHGIRRK